MKRQLYLLAGLTSLALGGVGVILPLLPTVPFVILAAFCFARSSPRLEAWLVEHPHFGSHIRDWRNQRAISKRGKYMALLAFSVSIILAALFVRLPWNLIPVAAALIGGTWIWTRADPEVKITEDTSSQKE